MFIACTNRSCSEVNKPKSVPTGPDGQPPPEFTIDEVHCGECRQTQMQEVPAP